ncbi:MAG: hypothetical protein U0X20_12825 [Caldilineaceae bacterium]
MLYMRQSLLAMLLVILSVGGFYSPAAAADTPKPTPTPGLKVEITAAATPVATPITGDGKTVDVALDQPFLLRQGQTGRIEAEDVSVTLRSLSEDSGCFSPDDCSTMLAEGTLAMQAGEDKTLLDFSAILTPDSAFTYELGDYVIAMVHVEANEDGERLATFVISSSRPAEVAVPEPRMVKRCPGFSRFDAAAILQADVNPRPVANLVFAPLSSSAPEPSGLCGYYTIEGGPETLADTPLDPSLPYLASQVDTPYAAVAGRLAGEETQQLLHLLALVAGGEGNLDDATLMQVQTEMAAGLSDEFLPTLYEVAQGNTDAQVEWIGSSDLDTNAQEALWLALPANAGEFVAAISHHNGEFVVVAAMVSPDVTAVDAKGYVLTVLNQLVE